MERPDLHIDLDWRAYFQSFCAKHGEPVLVEKENRLLFRDGWSYAADDYAGPEYPPPEDPRRRRAIERDYWTLRRDLVRDEHKRLQGTLRNLVELQERKDCPLVQRVRVEGDEGVKTERVPLDLTALELRLNWLDQDLVECEERLRSLKQETEDLINAES